MVERKGFFVEIKPNVTDEAKLLSENTIVNGTISRPGIFNYIYYFLIAMLHKLCYQSLVTIKH